MTGEVEQQFFKVFGIEPKRQCYYSDIHCSKNHCNKDCVNFYMKPEYPVITAEKLLEMICILNNYGKYDCWGVTVARLKDAILENCIAVVVLKLLNDIILEQFKHKIQQLFEEEGKNKLYANKDYE